MTRERNDYDEEDFYADLIDENEENQRADEANDFYRDVQNAATNNDESRLSALIVNRFENDLMSLYK